MILGVGELLILVLRGSLDVLTFVGNLAKSCEFFVEASDFFVETCKRELELLALARPLEFFRFKELVLAGKRAKLVRESGEFLLLLCDALLEDFLLVFPGVVAEAGFELQDNVGFLAVFCADSLDFGLDENVLRETFLIAGREAFEAESDVAVRHEFFVFRADQAAEALVVRVEEIDLIFKENSSVFEIAELRETRLEGQVFFLQATNDFV